MFVKKIESKSKLFSSSNFIIFFSFVYSVGVHIDKSSTYEFMAINITPVVLKFYLILWYQYLNIKSSSNNISSYQQTIIFLLTLIRTISSIDWLTYNYFSFKSLHFNPVKSASESYRLLVQFTNLFVANKNIASCK